MVIILSYHSVICGTVAELVDALDSKSCIRKGVSVRLRWVPPFKSLNEPRTQKFFLNDSKGEATASPFFIGSIPSEHQALPHIEGHDDFASFNSKGFQCMDFTPLTSSSWEFKKHRFCVQAQARPNLDINPAYREKAFIPKLKVNEFYREKEKNFPETIKSLFGLLRGNAAFYIRQIETNCAHELISSWRCEQNSPFWIVITHILWIGMALLIPPLNLANKLCSPKVFLNSLCTFKRIRLTCSGFSRRWK